MENTLSIVMQQRQYINFDDNINLLKLHLINVDSQFFAKVILVHNRLI